MKKVNMWNSPDLAFKLSTFFQIIAIAATIGAFIFGYRASKLQDYKLNETYKRAEDLESNQNPWGLSSEQKEQLATYLQHAPKGKIAVEYINADAKRVYKFAIELNELLNTVGYQVWDYIPGFTQAGSAPLEGIMVQVKDPKTRIVGDALVRAFQALGIKTIIVPRNNNNHEDQVIVIWVGYKPL